MSVLYVFLGGGLGAACRYGLSLMPVGMDFPAMTLLTNLVGALVIGAITELAAIHGTSGVLFALLENGILRRLYVPFLTFSLETVYPFFTGGISPKGSFIFSLVWACVF